MPDQYYRFDGTRSFLIDSGWPAGIDKPTPFQLQSIYEHGFQGAPWDPHGAERLLADGVVRLMSETAPHLRDTGKGKRAMLWRSREKYDPGAYEKEAQTTGDCFIEGTMVKVSDEREQAIEEIKAGDRVISHTGKVQRVLSKIGKLYSGKLVEIQVDDATVTATPDHQFCIDNGRGPTNLTNWRSIGELGLETPVCVLDDMGPNPNKRLCQTKFLTYTAVKNIHVYCLEVEEDHSFYANRFLVHNCTSHGDRNARDTTRSVEIHIKGEPEEYFKRGATEPTYGYRGFCGAGMSPVRAAEFVTKHGFLVRQRYPFVDLTKYDSRIGVRWGCKGGPPDEVLEECAEHNVGEYLVPESTDDCKDLLFNGYAGHSGQNIGFSDTSNQHGIYPVRGSWSHDMGTVGYDDTKEFYPSCVFMVQNSWGRWNNPPRKWPEDLFGPWIGGMIVVSEDTYKRFVRSGQMYYYSNVRGFPSQTLPDWGAGEIFGE